MFDTQGVDHGSALVKGVNLGMVGSNKDTNQFIPRYLSCFDGIL